MTVILRRVFGTVGWLLCGAMPALAGNGAPAQKRPAAGLLPLKVVGTQVRNSRNERVLLGTLPLHTPSADAATPRRQR